MDLHRTIANIHQLVRSVISIIIWWQSNKNLFAFSIMSLHWERGDLWSLSYRRQGVVVYPLSIPYDQYDGCWWPVLEYFEHQYQKVSRLGDVMISQCRDHFVYAPNQWEMMLQYNVFSHWLGAYTKWPLQWMKHGWSAVSHDLDLFKWPWPLTYLAPLPPQLCELLEGRQNNMHVSANVANNKQSRQIVYN